MSHRGLEGIVHEVFCPDCRFKQPARSLSRFIDEGMETLDSGTLDPEARESRSTGEL
ncbi:MAG: hypothetical protein ACRDJL_04430 [Actinomycetota bacterium]